MSQNCGKLHGRQVEIDDGENTIVKIRLIVFFLKKSFYGYSAANL